MERRQRIAADHRFTRERLAVRAPTDLDDHLSAVADHVDETSSRSLPADRDGDPDRQRRFLKADKMRIGPEPERCWLRIGVEHGMVLIGRADPFESGEQESTPAPAQVELTPEVERVLLGGPRRLADVARAVGRDPKDGTVRRVLERIGTKGEDSRWGAQRKGAKCHGTYRGWHLGTLSERFSHG
jgi:hypothetical protein